MEFVVTIIATNAESAEKVKEEFLEFNPDSCVISEVRVEQLYENGTTETDT